MRFINRAGTSIAAKLLLVTACLSLVLTLLISFVEIWHDANTTIENERSRARAAVMANVDTLALTL